MVEHRVVRRCLGTLLKYLGLHKDATKKEATFEFAKNVTKGKVTCRQEGDIEDKLLMLIPL